MGKDFYQAYHPVSQDNAYGPPVAPNVTPKIIPARPAGGSDAQPPPTLRVVGEDD
jgi:hypothetical protein